MRSGKWGSGAFLVGIALAGLFLSTGCGTDSDSLDGSIPVDSPVRFVLDKYEGEVPLTIVAQATSASDEPLPEGQYRWSFVSDLGESSEEAGSVATHGQKSFTFTTPGTYTISLALTLAGLSGPISCMHSDTLDGSSDSSRSHTAVVHAKSPSDLSVTSGDLVTSGYASGPFTPTDVVYTLKNTGSQLLTWSASKAQDWVSISVSNGILAPGKSTYVMVWPNTNANRLVVGSYSDTVAFTNLTNGNGNTTRSVSLVINPPAGTGPVNPPAGTGPASLSVSSISYFASAEEPGASIAPSQQTYTLKNTGGQKLDWEVSKTQNWVTLSAGSGPLEAGATTTITVSLNDKGLAVGSYSDTITFTNLTNGEGNTTRSVSLVINDPNSGMAPASLSVSPNTGLAGAGAPGGPFSPGEQEYVLKNTGELPLNWTANKGQNWVSLSTSSGTLAAGATANVTVSINTNANGLVEGSYYSHTISFTNTTNSNGSTTRSVSLIVSNGPQMANSVSQYGITWTFDKAYQVGQFVTGDWWVCPNQPGSEVVVVSVDPAPTLAPGRHGSMINPVAKRLGSQSHDERAVAYSASGAVSYPVALVADQSLISTISRPENDVSRLDILGGSKSLSRVALWKGAVLTCLAKPVAATVFRPPFAGSVKPLFDCADLRLDLLPDLSPPNPLGNFGVSLPSGITRCKQYASFFAKPWIGMYSMMDNAECVKPLDNAPGYYRESDIIGSEAALLMLFDSPDRLELVRNYVQLGIDMYYCIQTYPNPPQRHDRCMMKWPCVLAGMLLDNKDMQSNLNYTGFKTDGCTYAGIPWTVNYGSSYANVLWKKDDIPESYGHETLDPFVDGWCSKDGYGNSRLKVEGYRRGTHSWTWVGYALAARKMNAKTIWNHDPFFDYIDRWMEESEAAWIDALQVYVSNDPCGTGEYLHGLIQQGFTPGETTYGPPWSGESFTRKVWELYRW